MHLQLDGHGPLYDQIYRALKHLIDAGTLARGERLPGSRTLMRDLAVSRNSVLSALHMLEVEGYVEGRPGSGTYVAAAAAPQNPAPPRGPADPAGAAPRLAARAAVAASYRLAAWMGNDRPVRFDLRYGRVAFPPASRRAWTQAQARCLRGDSWRLRPAHPQGDPALRRALAAHLARSRGIQCDPAQILVTSGSQESIHLSMTALLEPGDRLVLEEPGYQPARLAAGLCGAELCGVAVDDHGLDPARLPESARLVFVTPSHQFPTGAVLPAARRQTLYDWARRCGAWIFEDDYDSEFRYDIRPLPALKRLDVDGRVIYGGSFSKTMSSGIRLGYLVAREDLIDALVELKLSTAGPAAVLVQRAMLDFLESGEYQRHLNRVLKIYRERRDRLLESLEARLSGAAHWRGSLGGIHVYLQAARPQRAMSYPALAGADDVAATEFPAPPGRLRLALGYGAIEATEVDSAVAALAAVLA